MGTFRTIVILLICSSSSGCSSDIEVQARSINSMTALRFENQFVGIWIDQNTIWSKAELQIKEDNTFTYSFIGCLGETFTEGFWRLEGKQLILKSLDNYRKLDWRMNIRLFSDSIKNSNHFKNKGSRWEYNGTIRSVRYTYTKYQNGIDTIYIDKVNLAIKGDSLEYQKGFYLKELHFGRQNNYR